MKVTSNGFGKLEATNGIDVITAEFERGKKVEGKFHTHWNLSINGKKKTVYAGKDEVMDMISDMLTKAIPAPLTEQATRKMFEEDGEVHGVIDFPLDDFIGNDLDDILDRMSSKLTEVTDLCDIRYHVVGVSDDGQTLQIRVSGKI